MKTRKPNIVIIMSDDQGAWAMGCAGNSDLRTPNLDRLAAEGILFDNFFCVSPVCSPARASFLTGRIPSSHGVHDWIKRGGISDEEGEFSCLEKPDRPIEYLAGMPGFTDFLASEGYVCGLSGKWHLGDHMRPQKGYTYWYSHAFGGGPYYNAPMILNGKVYKEPEYVTDSITGHALEFIDARIKDSAPFCLSAHYTAPHSPWDRDNHPAELWDDYRQNCTFTSTPDEELHPWQIPTAPCGIGEKRKDLLSGYYTSITAMDTGIGRIMDHLGAAGLREDTIIVFTSDNGMNMGHHGIWGKGNGTFPQNMFDTSVKVPFIISRPGSIPEGIRGTGLHSHYDFRPTILDYLNIHDPEKPDLPGISFAPFLNGESESDSESIVVFDEYGPVRMIRTREWKYVHRYPYGPHELYNLADDPDELKNLIEERKFIKLAGKMREQLTEWFLHYADPALDGTKEAVTGSGQLGPAGKAAAGQKAFEDNNFAIRAAALSEDTQRLNIR